MTLFSYESKYQLLFQDDDFEVRNTCQLLLRKLLVTATGKTPITSPLTFLAVIFWKNKKSEKCDTPVETSKEGYHYDIFAKKNSPFFVRQYTKVHTYIKQNGLFNYRAHHPVYKFSGFYSESNFKNHSKNYSHY